MKLKQSGTALDMVLDRYLQRQRSLGRGYAKEEWVIGSLRRLLVNAGASDLDQVSFEDWCKSQAGLAQNTRRQRQAIVRNFCLYRQRTEPSCLYPRSTAFHAVVRTLRLSSSVQQR